MSRFVLLLHTTSPQKWDYYTAPLEQALRDLSPLPVRTVHSSNATIELTPAGVNLHLNGERVDLSQVAGVVARALSSQSALITETLELAGVPVSNTPAAMRTANSKFLTSAALVRAGLPTPHQTLISAHHPAPDDVVTHHGTPAVLKRDLGSLGNQVFLVDNAAAKEKLAEPESGWFGWIVQDFISESFATDTRVLVTGGKVALTRRKTNYSGDFRSNDAQGSVSVVVEPTPRQVELALAATDALGLDVAGVDLLDGADGPTITELNCSPGLGATNELTGAPIIRKVAAAHLKAIGVL